MINEPISKTIEFRKSFSHYDLLSSLGEQAATGSDEMYKTISLLQDGPVSEAFIPKEHSEDIEIYKQPGAFLSAPPDYGLLKVLEHAYERLDSNVKICTLSAVSVGKREIAEKELWLKMYAPFLPVKNHFYSLPGQKKSEVIQMAQNPDVLFILIDDYTKNAVEFIKSGGLSIKWCTDENGKTINVTKQQPVSGFIHQRDAETSYRSISRRLRDFIEDGMKAYNKKYAVICVDIDNTLNQIRKILSEQIKIPKSISNLMENYETSQGYANLKRAIELSYIHDHAKYENNEIFTRENEKIR